MRSTMNEYLYYSRQRILKSIGSEGQAKLKKTKCLIVGAGGLGHPCTSYLAAAGVGEIGILDDDTIEESNLNRQILFKVDDVGKKKATILAQRIKAQNPYIHITPIVERLSLDNAADHLRPYDLILDCADNFPTKFLLHDFAWFFKKPLIHASIYHYEGLLQCFSYADNRDAGCLRCLWPHLPPYPKNCNEVGVIGATVGLFGILQAFETVKMVLNLGQTQVNTTIFIELIGLETEKISWKRDPLCPLCSRPLSREDLNTIHTHRLKDYEKEGLDHPKFTLIDIREPHEVQNCPVLKNNATRSWPLSQYDDWRDTLDQDRSYLFICQKGVRSENLVKKLRKEKVGSYFSLLGGIDGLGD